MLEVMRSSRQVTIKFKMDEERRQIWQERICRPQRCVCAIEIPNETRQATLRTYQTAEMIYLMKSGRFEKVCSVLYDRDAVSLRCRKEHPRSIFESFAAKSSPRGFPTFFARKWAAIGHLRFDPPPYKRSTIARSNEIWGGRFTIDLRHELTSQNSFNPSKVDMISSSAMNCLLLNEFKRPIYEAKNQIYASWEVRAEEKA
jgi:hypothetical protein